MSTDERVVNRRRLVRRLAEKLDEAPADQISNNDVRRLSENLEMVLQYLRWMEKYPEGVGAFNPCDVLRYDHVATGLLVRYSEHAEQNRVDAGLRTMIEKHLVSCSACRARVAYFKTQLVAGQLVRPGDPNQPRQPALHIDGAGEAPTTLTPAIGITAGGWRDNQ